MNKLEALLFRYFEYLDQKGKGYNALVGLLWTIVIGTFDIITHDEVKHSFFYLLPIAFVTWFSGKRLGFAIALLCTVLWSINNITGNCYITFWNISSTIFFLFSCVLILSKTRALWENEKTLSRTDPLTGVKNLRAFAELVEHEILRSQREGHPFSLAYLDLDNFKSVNDRFGHSTGDALLTAVVHNMVKNLRRTDVVGRMGGDEFAIFFPETDQDAVRVVMEKVRHELDHLMEKSAWQTTFSVGVITCHSGVYDFNHLINTVDSLMYDVKRGGKNDIRYALFPANRAECEELSGE